MAITDSGGVDYSGDFYDHVLRNHFLPEVADGINHDYVLLERFSALKDKSMVQGKFVQHPVHTGRNVTGVGAVGIDGLLPTPGNQQYDEYQYPIRSVYGRIKFTGLASDASASDIDSWLRAIDSELTGIRDDLARQENRMLMNDGSGVIGLITAANGADSATQTVSFWTGLEGNGSMQSSAMDTTHFLQVGQRVAVIDSGDSDNLEDFGAGSVYAGTVSSKTATTVTFNASVSAAANGPHYIVSANDPTLTATSQVSTGFQREPMGLGGIVSDANMSETYYESGLTAASFQNIAVSGNDFNQSVVLDNSSVRRPLTEALLQKLLTEIEKRLKGKVSVFISSFGVRDAFADLLLTYRRHVNRTELRAGFSTVTYGDLPIVPDRDAYPNRIMGIDESDIRQHCMGSEDYRFIDEDGSIYSRLADKHAFQAALYRRFTFGSMARARHGIIVDLDES